MHQAPGRGLHSVPVCHLHGVSCDGDSLPPQAALAICQWKTAPSAPQRRELLTWSRSWSATRRSSSTWSTTSLSRFSARRTSLPDRMRSLESGVRESQERAPLGFCPLSLVQWLPSCFWSGLFPLSRPRVAPTVYSGQTWLPGCDTWASRPLAYTQMPAVPESASMSVSDLHPPQRLPPSPLRELTH